MRRTLTATALVLLVACVILPKAVQATEPEGFTLVIINDKTYDQIYNVVWIDHPYRATYPKPMMVAGGELYVAKKRIINFKGYPAGKYAVLLFSRKYPSSAVIHFTVEKNTAVVLIARSFQKKFKNGERTDLWI